jgi:type I restriction enzyme M protein
MAIKKSQLYSKIWAACDELRGGMDASQYKDYVLVVLFIKYLSDKRKAGDTSLLVELPEGCSFDDLVLLKGSKDIGEKMNVILGRIAAANDLEGVVDNADFADETKLGKGKDLVDTVSGLVGVFQDDDLDFSNNRAADDDLIGDAYEYLMKNFATQSGKSKGQFYTPAEVSRVMAKVIGIGGDARKMVSIYDPTCGSGSLLLRAAAEAKGTVAIQGQEKDVATIGMARMSMVVHGVDDPDLRHGDTLTDPLHKRNDRELATFDYVVANPPFSLKSWLKGASEDDPFGRWGHGGGVAPVPPPKCGDYAFLLHVLKSMKPGGHAAVILPHGVLFRGNAEAEIRKFVVRRHWIKGIIGLPPNLFFGTGIPACILVLDKEGAAASKGIFLVDAKDGYAKDGAKNRLRECDIRRIVDVWNEGKDVPHYARFVPYAEIEANGFNLNLPRYVAPADREVKQDLAAHLHGGIPAGEAAKYPACLFKPLAGGAASGGRVALAVPESGIASALAGDPAMEAALAREKTACGTWLESFRSRGREIGKGGNPKQLVAGWGDGLLAALGRTRQGAGGNAPGEPLVSPYAIYEHLMNYWAETMQDDCFLVCRDGWQANLSMPRKRNFSWRDLRCDLLPPETVAKLRHPRDLEAIDAALAEAEQAQARIDELCEDLEEDDAPPPETAALKKKAAAAKKRAKAADAALAEKLVADYAAFGEGDIRDLVVENKWCDALSARFESEFDRRLSSIAAGVKALAERYAVPLPELEAEAAALRGKVLAHLKAMGVEA